MKIKSRIIIVVVTVFSIYSCAKKDTTTNSSASPTAQQPVTTNFSVNGVAANSPNPSAGRILSNYVVSATDNINYYPEIQITFHDTVAPVSGTYTIVRTANTAFQCSFLLTPNTSTITAAAISGGTVTVVAAASPNNSASFSKIVCTSATGTTITTYTVSGAIRY